MQIFISHAASDAATAGRLANALRKRGLEPWLDVSAAQVGAGWHREVASALEQSDAMVVLISPDAMRSKGVHAEIEHALLDPRFKNRLVPVVVRPTSKTSIPWILDELGPTKLSRSPSAVERLASRVAARLLDRRGGRTGSPRAATVPRDAKSTRPERGHDKVAEAAEKYGHERRVRPKGGAKRP